MEASLVCGHRDEKPDDASKGYGEIQGYPDDSLTCLGSVRKIMVDVGNEVQRRKLMEVTRHDACC